MLVVHVLVYASTLSYMPNVEFHSKESGVKDNIIANFLHVCKCRQERRFEHKRPIRDVSCKKNKHRKYHWAIAEAFHKIPSLQKSFKWKLLLLCKSVHHKRKTCRKLDSIRPISPRTSCQGNRTVQGFTLQLAVTVYSTHQFLFSKTLLVLMKSRGGRK